MSEFGNISIVDTNTKLSITNGMLLPSYRPQWQFIPLETLKEISAQGVKKDKRFKRGFRIDSIGAAFIMGDYFLAIMQAAAQMGLMPDGSSIEGTHILADTPTIWRFTFTPKDGEPREIAIEHDDLTPEKLAEMCR